jgi:transcriptional regulator with XRE-family HTH domain
LWWLQVSPGAAILATTQTKKINRETKMLKLEEIVKRLKDRKLSAVAEATGISYTSLWQIANGMQKQPKYKIVERLSDYLEDHE